MNNLYLSIIVPVYNVEQYLHKCLDSIVRQGFSEEQYEVIMVNDGSSDRSEAICKEFLEMVLAGKIGKIAYLSPQNSVAAGIRRIEALTGQACEDTIYALQDMMNDLKSMFNNSKDLKATLKKFIGEHDEMRKEIEKFQAQAVERTKEELLKRAQNVNGVQVIKAVLPLEPAAAKDLAFKLRENISENLVVVIGSTAGNKPLLTVMFSDDMVKDHSLNAGTIIREAAKLIQGGGGGQPHYAQAGGKNLDGISAAVDKVIELANL